VRGHRADPSLVDGRYALVTPQAPRGLGTVWRARDTLLERDVALKEVGERQVLDRARAAARLNHPVPVTVFDVIDDGERPAVVLELVDARPLAEVVEREGPLPERRAAAIGLEVLAGLEAAHAEGLVHGAVGPATVLVGRDGRVRLAGLGILPATAQPDPASDLWGLGAALWFAVEGEPPPHVRDRGRGRAAMLAPLLHDLLDPDPLARPGIGEARARLEEVCSATAATRPLPAPPAVPAARTAPTWPAPAPSPPRRRFPAGSGVAVAVAALVALAAAVVAVAWDDGFPGDPSASPPATDTAAPRATQPGPAGTVPAGWARYQDPDTGFEIPYPPGWTVSRSGTLTDFTDPASGAYLRVDHVQPPGPSAEGAWYDLERRFAAQYPGYRRIRIEPTTYAGYPAAVWEFTYQAGGAALHALDLGFITGDYGFALYFQTHEADWQRMQPVFEAFKAGFRAPSG
jgi:hypothetical protein